MIWGRRRTHHAEADGTAARELDPALEPIQLFLATGPMSGFIDAGGERVSDLLAKQPVLRISDETDTWTSIAVEDLIVVAPPTHASTRRVHRAKRRITLSAPPYEVTGTVHLPPGTQLDPFMVRTGQRVLAVTNPWIHDVERGEEHYPPVAIVLVPAISWARELIGPA